MQYPVTFYRQNEETDDEGFFVQDQASFDAETRFLKEAGCPDTDKIEWHGEEATDRDESFYYAEAPLSVYQWLEAEEALVDFDPAEA